MLTNKIFLHLLISVTAYTVIYCIVCYGYWEIAHPFQWIIDLPKIDGPQRGCYLIAFLFYQAAIAIAVSSIKLNQK